MKTFRYGSRNPEKPTVLLLAPTGVAAINIDGTTINSALAIPKDIGDRLNAMSDQKRTQMRLSLSELKLIIVDEISMVSNITMLHMHLRLNEIFATCNSELFAGQSVIAVGDLYQLPPIRRKCVFENYNNDTLNLYHPWHIFKIIELTQIMRQKDDQAFTELLNRFRTGSQTEEDIQCIQSRSINTSDDDYPTDALHIWAENNPVMEYNNVKLEEISKPLYQLKATDQYPSNVSKQDIDRVLARGRSETGGLDFEIFVKETSRVMLTTNIDIADRLINGQMGTIAKIDINQITQKPSIIYIKFDDRLAGNTLINKCNNQFAKENGLVPIKRLLTRIKVRPGKPSSPEIQRMQFPIALAWACTVHKVQGLTLDKVVISFDLFKQRYFNFGQVYVAISRSKTLQGIHVLGQIKHKYVKINPKVHEEYDRLRNIEATNSTQFLMNDEKLMTISLLNIRSLKKHSIDIKFDSNINNSDLIALTETQLLPQSNDNDIKMNLEPFMLHRQDHNTDRFSSLAVCIRSNIKIQKCEYFSEINAAKFDLYNNINKFSTTLLLLYKKCTSHVLRYVESLRYTITTNDIDVILGDFNINYFNNDEVKSLKEMMTSFNYSQVVQSPTFVSSGSLLDHVYVKPCFEVQHCVIAVYYSDHDSVKVIIANK